MKHNKNSVSDKSSNQPQQKDNNITSKATTQLKEMHQQKDQIYQSPTTQKSEPVKSDNEEGVDIYDFQAKTINQQSPNSGHSQCATINTLLQTGVVESDKQQKYTQSQHIESVITSQSTVSVVEKDRSAETVYCVN
jgi:hypothetical protein